MSFVSEMKMGRSMNVFIATKSGIKVLGRVLTISSMDLIIISRQENYNPKNAFGIKRRQAHMHQNLLNAECAPVEYLKAKNKNMHVIRVMKALTKVLLKCFC
jgi:hypothetical protein